MRGSVDFVILRWQGNVMWSFPLIPNLTNNMGGFNPAGWFTHPLDAE